MKKLIRYIIVLSLLFLIILLIFQGNVKVEAFNEDWTDYGINDIDLYNKSNTYNGTINIGTNLVDYDMQN